MKTFKEAYEYLRYTDAENIAKRTAIYGAFVNMYMHENFAHDYYLDIVAALGGPFNFDCIIDDEKMINMLKETQFGYVLINNSWTFPLFNWVQANCSTDDYIYVKHIIELLISGKGDEILQYFNYIVNVIRPSQEEYFPEMFSFYVSNPWPRI